MTAYIDTSAFVKRYIEEPHSDFVQRVIGDAQVLISSALTELEMVSAFERLKKSRLIDSPTYRAASKNFESDVEKNFITFLAVSPPILAEAKRLVKLRHLRPPDAIQLASALFANRKMGFNLPLLCFDDDLRDAARLEGLKCLS